MKVSHTVDGYWVLSGYVDQNYGDAQTIMAKAKKQFIKANPLIEPTKVVVVNGEFGQFIDKSLASMIIDSANLDEAGYDV